MPDNTFHPELAKAYAKPGFTVSSPLFHLANP